MTELSVTSAIGRKAVSCKRKYVLSRWPPVAGETIESAPEQIPQPPEDAQNGACIRHMSGVDNHWGDLLSRLRSVGRGAAGSREEVSLCVRSIAVVATADDDYSIPSMGEIRDVKKSAVIGQRPVTRRTYFTGEII